MLTRQQATLRAATSSTEAATETRRQPKANSKARRATTKGSVSSRASIKASKESLQAGKEGTEIATEGRLATSRMGLKPPKKRSKAAKEGTDRAMGEDREARQEGYEAAKTTESGHSEDQDDAPTMVDVLPDDVLVQVLSLLDMGSVLRARMTCRRLRDLGAHPDVWRRRELCPKSNLPISLVEAVLRVAPCAREVTLNFRKFVKGLQLRKCPRNRVARNSAIRSARGLAALFRTTGCASERLEVLIIPGVSVTAVRNQLALGRIRALDVEFRVESEDSRVSNLVHELFTARGKQLEKFLYTEYIHQMNIMNICEY